MATNTFTISGAFSNVSFYMTSLWSSGLPVAGQNLVFAVTGIDYGVYIADIQSNFANPYLIEGTGTVSWTMPNAVAGQDPFELWNQSQIWINTATANYTAVGSGSFTLQEYSSTPATANSGFVNDGAVDIMGGTATITNTGVMGNGRIDLFNNTTLSITGFVGGGQKINFMGTAELLTLNTPKYFTGNINSFQAGDTIDLIGVTGTTVTVDNRLVAKVCGLI